MRRVVNMSRAVCFNPMYRLRGDYSVRIERDILQLSDKLFYGITYNIKCRHSGKRGDGISHG